MKTSMRQPLLAAILAAAGMLAACGGGSSGSAGSAPATSAASSAVLSSSASSSEPSDSAVSSSAAAQSSTASATSGCSSSVWFCDDFQSGTADNWELAPAGTGSAFAVVDEPGVTGNKVLQYTAGKAGGVIALLKDSVWATIPNKSDYYVEARIKPQNNSTTANKQLFLIGRYQDASNWMLGGLNVQSTSAATQVNAGYNKAGIITRPVAVNKPMVLGTQGSTDGEWYTVRFEMVGAEHTVYFEGEKINATPITDSSFAAGKIGLFTNNRSFLIDDIKVGDPSIKPVQLTLSPSATSYVAEVGDAPYAVTVTARTAAATEDSFTVVSSKPEVAQVSVNGSAVSITPKSAGTAVITFTSGSKPDLVRRITATINPAFVQPVTTYGNLSALTVPAAGSAAAYTDELLSLSFDAAPTLTQNGSIRIFKNSDDSLVDVIKLADESDAVGPAADGYYRGVKMPLAWVSGSKLFMRPHQGKLQYGSQYYVAIAEGVVTGASIAGSSFKGLGKSANWSFSTRTAPLTTLTDLVVDDDGSTADFRSIQGAINYVMKNVAKDTAASITVKNGSYPEVLFLRNKNKLTIKGESRSGVVLSFDNNDGLNPGSGASVATAARSGGGRAVFLVEASDELTLDNFTLRNPRLRTGAGDQAEVIYFNSPTGRLIAKNADFYSEQDTLQLNGYVWFYNALVAGNVDYIWGSAKAALFENCEIRTVGDSKTPTVATGGYILQTRVAAATDKGFVFLNSSLTSANGPAGNAVASGSSAATYLARSAGNGSFDNVVFVNSKIGEHIAATGWLTSTSPTPNPATATSGWREYGSTRLDGSALDTSGRASVARTLSSGEVAPYASRAAVFSAISWDPTP
ncbi:pectinesterase family protein [Uliginosibacterium aquaticum]|uniref:Pectin methylesterase n=1 Tax=Uliginosibacterium aquaticum TaxID=2731212 RepID=A0ABX2IDF8_9RHOO|nr:pectinesterase family protein [Uliginosibacterium aquaticum]NSL53788.1 pectin methylesterase [Uliginosibacterium aquaticum]